MRVSERWLLALILSFGLIHGLSTPAFCAPAESLAQSPADSLRMQLQRADMPDTARVLLGLRLVSALDEENASPAERRRLLLASLALARRIGFVGGELEVLNNLGALANMTSDLPTAQRYFSQAIRRARQTRETRFRSESLRGLGGVALSEQEFARAATLFEQAADAAEPLTPYYGGRSLELALSDLSKVYLVLNREAEARRVFRRLLALSRQKHDATTELFALANWGTGLLVRTPDSAAVYLAQAVDVATQMDVPYYRAYATMALMQVREQQGRWADVGALARQTLRLARESQTPDYESEALVSLAKALRRQGQPAVAFDTLSRAYTLMDTLWSREKRDELARQQVAFDVGAKEARIRALEQQRRIATLTADRQAARTQLLIGGLVALVALLALGSGFLIRLRRSQAALVASEAEAQAAAAAARRAEEKAHAANATKDQIMSVIGHDLRGPVASFQQLTPVLRQLVPTGPGASEAQRLLDSLAAGARHLGELLDNLLRWARSEDGNTVNYPTYLPAVDVAGAVAELLQPVALAKQITLRLQITPAHLQLFADPDLLATVLRNLVTNALKFTPTGGQVTLSISTSIDSPDTSAIRIAVTDNGIGIAPERIRHLLETAGHDSTRGTADELGTGLGLPLSARFVRLMGGELKLTSQPHQGTEAAFELPPPPPRFKA